jgi:branched-chain amino acid transport system substrate-binding protein
MLVTNDSAADRVSLSSIHGAELAMKKANAEGGYRDRPFSLQVRSCDGPWGVGSKVAANLIYEEKVWAVLGALDGRNAHLAEQVITKSHVPLLCTKASDPSLAQTYIPWFFRVIPDDLQQGRALAEAISRMGLTNTVILVERDYDGEKSSSSFKKECIRIGIASTHLISMDKSMEDYSKIIAEIKRVDFDAVVLFCTPGPGSRVYSQMRQQGLYQPIFCSMSVLSGSEFVDAVYPNDASVYAISPNFHTRENAKGFIRDFQQKFGYAPNSSAAFAYDGMTALIDAIKEGGLDKANIRDALSNTKIDSGVTGTFSFLKNGNREGAVGIRRLANLRSKE